MSFDHRTKTTIQTLIKRVCYLHFSTGKRKRKTYILLSPCLYQGLEPSKSVWTSSAALLSSTYIVGRQEAGKLVIFVVEVVGGRKQARWAVWKAKVGGGAAPPTTYIYPRGPLLNPRLD